MLAAYIFAAESKGNDGYDDMQGTTTTIGTAKAAWCATRVGGVTNTYGVPILMPMFYLQP